MNGYTQLKTLCSRVDEVGKLILSIKLYMYIHAYTGYPIMVYRYYIAEFLHSNIATNWECPKDISKVPSNKCRVLQ